jgi:hypothetical protein
LDVEIHQDADSITRRIQLHSSLYFLKYSP